MQQCSEKNNVDTLNILSKTDLIKRDFLVSCCKKMYLGRLDLLKMIAKKRVSHISVMVFFHRDIHLIYKKGSNITKNTYPSLT